MPCGVMSSFRRCQVELIYLLVFSLDRLNIFNCETVVKFAFHRSVPSVAISVKQHFFKERPQLFVCLSRCFRCTQFDPPDFGAGDMPLVRSIALCFVGFHSPLFHGLAR
jgi:hypothetical protein